MNQSRRKSSNRNRRSRKRGGADLSPAPLSWSEVRMNAQPSQGVMRWATTAGAPMPSAAEMRNVAHGGKRRTRGRKHSRKHSRKHKHSRRCKHSRRKRSTRRH
jgi:hypothetical protein